MKSGIFLREFKEIASKRGIDLIPRRETNENLAQLGLTKKNCKEVYIKLKIAQVGEEKIAKCLSFHTPNFPLCYPYKEELKKGGDRK